MLSGLSGAGVGSGDLGVKDGRIPGPGQESPHVRLVCES
nr:hypothetical protein [Kibdelosporangium sp. MJ126-NF4]CTQ98365.1 hypothetical protein [Kibdelosporangium sp. MJ126-NF4]